MEEEDPDAIWVCGCAACLMPLLVLVATMSAVNPPTPQLSQNAVLHSRTRSAPVLAADLPSIATPPQPCLVDQIDRGHWLPCDPSTDSRCPTDTFFRQRKPERWQAAPTTALHADASDGAGCLDIPYYTQEDALACLGGRHVALFGDSTMNELALELIAVLEHSPTWIVDAAWLFDPSTCSDLRPYYHFRSFSTSRASRRVPYMARHNITVNFMWNANPNICENYGRMDEMLHDESWKRRAERILTWRTCPGESTDSNGCSRESVDVLVFGLGIHQVPAQTNQHDGSQPRDHYARRWAEALQEWMQWLEPHAHVAVWKDPTPSELPAEMYPSGWLELQHTVARTLMQSKSVRKAWRVWPVHHLLTYDKNRDKPGGDWRHCSQMHLEAFDSTETERRTLDVRTPVCTAAVQLLLHTLCNHHA